jgi:hypothetical protein
MISEGFKKYARKQKLSELKPWSEGDDMLGVSIGGEDSAAGSPKNGDLIARNPENHDDQWLVAAKYFSDNFNHDPVEES